MLAIIFQKTDDDSRCLICNDLYNDPFLLECRHTICSSCIHKKSAPVICQYDEKYCLFCNVPRRFVVHVNGEMSHKYPEASQFKMFVKMPCNIPVLALHSIQNEHINTCIQCLQKERKQDKKCIKMLLKSYKKKCKQLDTCEKQISLLTTYTILELAMNLDSDL